jgi:hypothetical protein
MAPRVRHCKKITCLSGGRGGCSVFRNSLSWLIDPPDGRIPPLTAAGRERQAVVDAAAQHPAGPEDLGPALRCITRGVPRLGGNFGAGPYSYYQIVQTPNSRAAQRWATRRGSYRSTGIRISRRTSASGPEIRAAGWEGKTLVIDTDCEHSDDSERAGLMIAGKREKLAVSRAERHSAMSCELRGGRYRR